MNLSSSLVQTVSVTTITTWCGTLKRIGEWSIPLVRHMGVRAKIDRVLKLKSPREIIKTIG